MVGWSSYSGKSFPCVRSSGSSQVRDVPVEGLMFPWLTETTSGDDLGLGLSLDSGVPCPEGGLNAAGFRNLLFVLVM